MEHSWKSCSFGTYSVFGMKILKIKNSILPAPNSRMNRLQFTENKRKLILLGTNNVIPEPDYKESEDCSKRMYPKLKVVI